MMMFLAYHRTVPNGSLCNELFRTISNYFELFEDYIPNGSERFRSTCLYHQYSSYDSYLILYNMIWKHKIKYQFK